MATPLSADKELDAMASKSTAALYSTMNDLLYAKVARTDEREPYRKLQQYLAQTLALSSLMGRRRTLLQVRSFTPKFASILQRRDLHESFLAADIVSPFVPFVEFQEAIDDILKRYPKLAPGYKRVQEEYARGHAYALAKSTDLVLTRKVQQTVTNAIKQGSEHYGVIDTIAAMGDWSRAYATTVYTTNTANAYAAGVVAQAFDPDIEEVCPALTLIGPTQIPPTRKNHAACVGLVAATRDRLWDRYCPPLGYACRHGINTIDKFTLKRRGMLDKDGKVRTWLPPNFSQAHPDEGFGQGSLQTRLGMVL